MVPVKRNEIHPDYSGAHFCDHGDDRWTLGNRVSDFPTGDFEGKPAEKYEDSRNFNTQMKDYTAQVVNGISARKYFETEGKFDPNKIVDIEAYDQKKIYGQE